jgi:molybdopterin molybdotransferase
MIYDSNTPMLASSVQAAGGNVLVAEMLADDPSAIRDFLDQTVESGATLLLSSAGVSVGAFDLVRDVLEEFGHLIFWRVNMRPGKPLAFGLYRNVPFLALPGNPVSAFVSFEVFGKTALARLSGQRHVQRTRLTARLAQEIESDGRESYLRVSVQRRDGEYWATLAGDQDSSVMSTLLQANGLLVMPAGVRRLPAGESTLVWLLDTTIVDAGT